jgi:hypothetical protein
MDLREPAQFSFKAARWPAYRRHVCRWLKVSKANTLDEKTKVDLLLYVMGERAEDVISNYDGVVVEEMTVEQVLDLFSEYFCPSTSDSSKARSVFWGRDQRTGESNADFVIDLMVLIDPCYYGEKENEMMRDKLCQGMRDRELAAKLRREKDLTLERVMDELDERNQSTRREREQESSSNVKRDTKLKSREKKKEIKVVEVSSVRRAKRATPPPCKHIRKGRCVYEEEESRSSDEDSEVYWRSQVTPRVHRCKWCGFDHMQGHRFCPAARAVCYRCEKRGHYARKCTVRKECTSTRREHTELDEEEVLSTILDEEEVLSTILDEEEVLSTLSSSDVGSADLRNLFFSGPGC